MNVENYRIGDVANGHVLTEQGWLPLAGPGPEGLPGGTQQPWYGWSGQPLYPVAQFDPGAELAADSIASGIATYQRVAGVVWIVLGALQILSIVLIIAGIWNVIAGISRLAVAPRIERREAAVPALFAGVVGLVLIGLVNLFFGAMLGVVMVAVDFYIRQRILDNRQIFNR